MRILVTGGAGYVGGHVVLRLRTEGARVGVLDNLSNGSLANLAPALRHGLRTEDVMVADIRDAGLPQTLAAWRPNVIVHLAAQPAVAASVADPLLDASVNILGTLHILQAAVVAGVSKVVFASSGGTIYGSLPPRLNRATENTPRHPLSPYGLSKSTADGYLRLYGRLHGLRFTSLALGNVYGPRLDGARPADVAGRFVFALLAGERPVIHGDGRQTRDFVHVRDVAAACLLACERGDGAFLNIGTGVETSVRQLLRLAASAVEPGSHPEVEQRPAQPGEAARVCLDAGAARVRLGWRARIPLDEGLADLAASARLAVAPSG